jgi:hypothetical protein
MVGTRSAWTPERRARQANIVRRTQPWTRSTGPKTKAGKQKSAHNALAFRTNPEARLANDLTQQFFSTGVVAPALGELWLAAYLDPVPDDFLLFGDASHDGLDDAPDGNLLDSTLDYLPGDGDGDDWLMD